jgi:uncharacterized LabA/DUF88 family protein
MREQRTLTAVLIDFENIFYYLKNTSTGASEISDSVVQVLSSLRNVLSTYEESVISMDAYADFDRIEESAQSSLYLVGCETHNVLGTDHKNAADMKLCIDALEILYTRREIGTFVVVGGDRDYIPLIRHLKKHGRVVRVVGFRQSTSGDLLTTVGEDYFIDATTLLTLPPGQPSSTAARTTPSAPTTVVQTPGDSFATSPVNQEHHRKALTVMLQHFGDKREIWLTPFLNQLRQDMPELTELERKDAITTLREQGAVKVEKRPGQPFDYSVIIVNWNHPLVQESRP